MTDMTDTEKHKYEVKNTALDTALHIEENRSDRSEGKATLTTARVLSAARKIEEYLRG